MKYHEVIEAEAELLALAGSLRAEELLVSAFKLFFIKDVLRRHPSGAIVEEGRLVSEAEDFEGPFDRKRLMDLMLETGTVARTSDGRYLILPRLDIGSLYVDAPVSPTSLGALSPATKNPHLEPAGISTTTASVDVEACLASLARSSVWARELITRSSSVQSNTLLGVPTFWDCSNESHGVYKWTGGSFTTVEALLLLLDQRRFGFPQRVGPDDEAAIRWLVQLLMRTQDRRPGATLGAFVWTSEDDDYVDSFDDGRPELGACPTVDVASTALRALSIVADHPSFAGVPQIRETVTAAVEFVLAQQNPIGGWDTLAFPDRRVDTVRETSSKMAIEGLAAAASTRLLDAHLESGVQRAAETFLRLVGSRAHRIGDAISWAPLLSVTAKPVSVQLFSTMWVGSSLLAIERRWPELASTAMPLCEGAARFLETNWEPTSSYTAIPIRVPTWRGPSARVDFAWEVPTDPFVAAFLLDYAADGVFRPSADLRRRLKTAVATALATERHGHWNDFKLKAALGVEAAMPGNTLHYCQLLWAYLALVRAELGRLPTGVVPS